MAAQNSPNEPQVDEKSIFEWRISNFSSLSKKVGEKILSPMFLLQNTNWQLELYPKGVDDKFNGYVSVYLKLRVRQNGYPVDKDEITKFQLSIIDCNQENVAVFETEHSFTFDGKYASGIGDFIEYSELTGNKNSLLPNETLTVCCEILPNSTEKENDDDESESSVICEDSCLDTTSESSSANGNNDYAVYFDNKQNSDVKFVSADNKHVYAHKVILIEKSEVFANLFSMEVTVLSPDVIYVNDIDYDVLYEVFRFIYTGEVRKIEIHVMSLLSVAKRFKFNDLKAPCEECLREDLCDSNAVELLLLAEEHELSRLRHDAKKFIASNMKNYVNSGDLRKLMKLYPKTAVEIVRCSVE